MSTAWPDGTPRSTGNAFDWSARPVIVEKPMTPADINRAKARAAWRRKQAEKVNANTHIGAHCSRTNSGKAAR